MAVGTEAAVTSVEVEAFASKIPSLIPMSKSLYALAKDRFTNVPVSFTTTGGATTRPSFRVPYRVQGGAAIAQGTGNGDSLGTGNASIWNDFVLSPIWHYAVNQITTLAALATNGKKRGLVSLKAEELKNSLDSAMAGIEGIMYGDSSGAITQIPTTGTVSSSSGSGNQTSYITGVRAMAFTDNQVVQFFAAEGGAARSGTATISINDPVTSTLWFSTALPAATAAGDYIMIAGSTGAVGQGVYGTTAWNNSTTSGIIAGINRATYPSRISTPSVNLNGGSVVASLSQRLEALVGRAMGESNVSKDSGMYLMGEDQRVAIAETTYYNKQINLQNGEQGKSGNVPDVSKKYFDGTFGGREVHLSYVQPLGRIDMLITDQWSIGELIPLQLYDYGNGNTTMPTPGTNSDWLTSNQFAYVTSFNMANSAPRYGAYVINASQPSI
jgi:hypothetical protein